MTIPVYIHVDKVENEDLTQEDWNELSQAVADISGAGMSGKADLNGNVAENFNAKKMTVHEDLTLLSGVSVNKFSDDGTLFGDSDATVPTERAIKAYADTKATLAGDSTQDFDTNNLRVYGNLEVTGETISRNIEQVDGDVILGNADTDSVTIYGSIVTANTSGQLKINSNTEISAGLSLQNGVAVNEFSDDGNLTDNSDNLVATQKAVKTYADNQLATKADKDTLQSNTNAINSQLDGKAAINGSNAIAFNTSDLSVAGSSSFGDNVIVQGDLEVSGSITGDFTQHLNDLDLGGIFENDVILGSDENNTVQIMGKLISGIDSDALYIDDALSVTGNVTLGNEDSDQIVVEGTISSGHSSDALYIDDALSVAGEVAVGSDLNVIGNTALDGNVTLGDQDSDQIVVEGTVSSGHSSNALYIDDALSVTGEVAVGSDLNVIGNTTLDGNVNIGTSESLVNVELKGDLLLDSGVPINKFSTDGTMRGNSDSSVPTENAVKTYADTKARLAGDSTQNFYTNKLRVSGGLRVSGLSGTSVSDYHSLTRGGVNYNTGTSGNTSSISAQYKVSASEFMAYSDRRIKRDLSPTDNQQDLSIVNQLELTNYHYIDGIGNGSNEQKKLIAQQVESVYPQAVTQGEEFIPNVYQNSASTRYDENTQHLEIILDVKHDFTPNDEVRLMVESGQEDYRVVAVSDEYSFTVVSDASQDSVFVFGKKVDDFRHIDYTAISMLGMSAIQQLTKENEQLKQRLDSLEQKQA
jgi:hypothetical protein